MKTVKLQNGKIVKLQFWDTAGQERFKSITSSQKIDKKINIKITNFYRHYRNALGAILVYDITKELTFYSLSKWIDEIKNQTKQNIFIMLVGNKLDLVQNNQSLRKVTKRRCLIIRIRKINFISRNFSFNIKQCRLNI
ncbi:hypothetical protein IMG5_203660 [Ichthyophthirius multifiliis]|uniref:Ras family protein n=1 Tax=Ichthyophthirius multifiliis TaxID=5932 RepID=G0R6C6_ICHMU|nr:hypothetical protein IMG5_203660 [Ichthyophthirius multifiliis]EGR26967.1 hypothetical protein IMG5_203660 [Ichthyophthirius multifiliis]|eukprot:XP_004023851.1 hypothetical protein IMG5_203660 [Ichthyophthirius multifiliis]